MPKSSSKSVKQKKTSKTTKSKPKKTANADMEKVLVQNFISLQKVMTNLAIKFDALNSQISKLLELFEISAKTLAEKEVQIDKIEGKPGTKNEEKMVEKLDMLLDQNKIIARGLTLLHEPQPMPQLLPKPIPQKRPMPQQGMSPPKMQAQPSRTQPSPGGYQKSPGIKKPTSKKPVKKPSRLKRRKKEDESVF